jgi:AraC-like DNA-binding protein
MLYRRVRPSPPLSDFVSCLWYSEGFEGTHERERLLPNGEAGIVFDLRERPARDSIRIWNAEDERRFESFAPAIFCGARTDCFVIDTEQQQRVIGIQFRAGGAFPFLGMPACEVANNTYALDDIWPGESEVLREQLMAAPSAQAMFAILERALLSRLRHSAHLHPAVAFAVGCLSKPNPTLRVSDLAERVGMGPRRFMEIFREQTGLTPKAFQRVRRFQRVLRTLHAGAEENWSAIAADCGYFDQPHFIHDFRSFSGLTPGEYVALATPHLNHVPML